VPIAQPDLARTLLGVPVVVAVLSNDEGAGLAVVGYTRPAAGTLALNPDQSFTFTPAPGFEGTDSFTYTARDAAGGPPRARSGSSSPGRTPRRPRAPTSPG
jgi:hypothetical protein